MMKIKNILALFLIGFVVLESFATEYHVSKKGKDTNTGLTGSPFNTIFKAVEHAFPGDTITVHEGMYREWVNPIRGGNRESERILFRAAPNEKVEIKGSEVIKDWKKVKKESGRWKYSIRFLVITILLRFWCMEIGFLT